MYALGNKFLEILSKTFIAVVVPIGSFVPKNPYFRNPFYKILNIVTSFPFKPLNRLFVWLCFPKLGLPRVTPWGRGARRTHGPGGPGPRSGKTIKYRYTNSQDT